MNIGLGLILIPFSIIIVLLSLFLFKKKYKNISYAMPIFVILFFKKCDFTYRNIRPLCKPYSLNTFNKKFLIVYSKLNLRKNCNKGFYMKRNIIIFSVIVMVLLLSAFSFNHTFLFLAHIIIQTLKVCF